MRRFFIWTGAALGLVAGLLLLAAFALGQWTGSDGFRQRVEREAAAEIDARIAALPDEPSRTLKSLLGELFQEVFDEARPAGEKLSASIIKVEEELGDEVWSRGQMVGDGSLLERVRMLREIVGLE